MANEQIWDFWAKGYEGLWVQKYSLEPTRRRVITHLKETLRKDQSYKILDVGCGIGQLLRDIKKAFPGFQLELVGIDSSQEMVNRAKGFSGDIVYQVLDVEQIKDLEESFDLVICTHSFPYYQGQRVVLESFRDLLSEDGSLLLAQASQNTLYDQLSLFFVKFTTGKAYYPSVKAIEKMVTGLFSLGKVILIKEIFFMPSIYLFVLKGAKR